MCNSEKQKNKQVVTFLLLPTWYTNFLFIHTDYIKLNFSTCFERNPLIIRRSTQIVHMQPLVSSLSASDRLVQPLRKDQSVLSDCTRRSLAESDDTRDCTCAIWVDNLLMMSGLRSKHEEEFNQYFLSGCTRQSLAESDDTRDCIRTIYVVDLLMMGGMRSKRVEESNLMSFV